MFLPVAIRVKQYQVSQLVILVVPIPMMQLDFFFDLDHLPTAQAYPVLLSQDLSTKRRRRMQRQSAVAILEVGLPGGVKRIGLAFDLEIALRFDCLPHSEQLLAGDRIREAPLFSRLRRKVAINEPAPGFARVTALGPAIHSLPDKIVELGEALTTDTMPMIVRPTPEQGGEGIDELLWRGTCGLLTEGTDLGREGLKAGLAGSNPQLGRFAVRALMFAQGLP